MISRHKEIVSYPHKFTHNPCCWFLHALKFQACRIYLHKPGSVTMERQTGRGPNCFFYIVIISLIHSRRIYKGIGIGFTRNCPSLDHGRCMEALSVTYANLVQGITFVSVLIPLSYKFVSFGALAIFKFLLREGLDFFWKESYWQNFFFLPGKSRCQIGPHENLLSRSVLEIS